MLVCLGWLCIAVRPAVGQDATGSDAYANLRVVAQRALENSGDVAARLSAYRAQRRLVDAAEAGRLPRADFNGSVGTERSTALDANGGSRNYSGNSDRATLSLRQPLYDGSEVASEVERQKRLTNVRYFELRAAEDAVLQEVARSWIDLQRQRGQIEVSRENVRNHEQLVRLVRERSESGVGRRVDVDQAQGRVASAQLALVTDEAALMEAITRFRRYVQAPVPLRIRPLEVLPSQLPPSERSAVADAIANAPAVRSAQENVAVLDAERRVRRAAFSPRLGLEARHDLHARTASLRDAASSSVQLTLSFNLFAGGGDVAREDDAALRTEQARQQHLDAIAAARQGVGAAWIDGARLATVQPSAAAYVKAVASARDAYREQYSIGQRSLLDLLNSENEVAQARRQLANVEADIEFSRVRLLSATGQLAQVLGVQRSPAEPVIAPVSGPADTSRWLSDLSDAGSPEMRSMLSAGIDRAAPPPLPLSPPLEPAVPAAPAVPRGAARITPLPSAPSTAPLVASAQPPAAPAVPPVAVAPPSAVPVQPAPSPTTPAQPAPRAALGPPVAAPEGLPRALAEQLSLWQRAMRQGPAAGRRWYEDHAGVGAAPTAWDPATGAAGTAPVSVLSIERIDAPGPAGGAPQSVQLTVLAEQAAATGWRCMRSAQIWRRSAYGDLPEWRLLRERVVSLQPSMCGRSG